MCSVREVETMADLPVASDLLDAEMVLWRVFGIGETLGDLASPGWSEEATRGPKLTDALRVSIGDLPADLLQSLTEWRAQLSGLLEMQVGNLRDAAERVALYERDLPTIELREFENPYPNWFVLRLSRPLQVSAVRDAVVGWVVDDTGSVAEALLSFGEEGAKYIDGAIASMIGPLGITNLSHLRFGDDRPFIVAPDRAATALGRLELTVHDWGVQVGRQPGYAATLTASVGDALRALPSGKQIGKATAGPARWFVAAKAEETDNLRRFVFAFVGLEMLVTHAEKDARTQLVKRLTDLDTANPIPVVDLLWPGTNEDMINRNLVFRFAALASVCSPATAVEDVAMFRDLAKARNLLFHGAENGVDKSRSVQCLELLRTYLGLVAGKAG